MQTIMKKILLKRYWNITYKCSTLSLISCSNRFDKLSSKTFVIARKIIVAKTDKSERLENIDTIFVDIKRGY
jgi:hypothetical protein